MGLYSKAIGAVIGLNGQVGLIIWAAFQLADHLDYHKISGFWKKAMWFTCGLLILHSYYVLFSYLNRLDQLYRSKQADRKERSEKE